MVDMLKSTQHGSTGMAQMHIWSVLDAGAQWRYLPNTIELSLCGHGDVALCQFTLTACSWLKCAMQIITIM